MAKDYFLKPADDMVRIVVGKDAGIDELIGVCRGILADGKIVESEVEYLNNWINRHPEASESFVGKSLHARLQRICMSGITAQDCDGLKAILEEATSETPVHESVPTSLPLDNPEPTVTFAGKAFCFTGDFLSGSRSWCMDEVTARGGSIHDKPLVWTDFLVIGSVASPEWACGNYGRKIEKAVRYRETYKRCRIICEKYWVTFLK